METVDSMLTDSMMLVIDWYTYSNTPIMDGSK